MDTKKKISIGLAMAAIMVAAVFAPMALAQGPWVHYEVEVLTPQDTFICCGPDGNFGKMFIGGTKQIIGTFGLQNIGSANALVDAKFLTSFSGVFGLVDDPATPSKVIPATNFALRPHGNESTNESFHCCSDVETGNFDVTTPLIGFATNETYHDANSSTHYDCGEEIYRDVGGNALLVEDGDIRLTDVQATNFYPCGSPVKTGDDDDGWVLRAFDVTETHADNGPTPNAYDCYEWIYDETSGSIDNQVDSGDHRLTFVQAMCDCVPSGDCPAGAYEALDNLGADARLNGYVPGHGLCCCYNAKLTVPAGTVEDHYVGKVQLTFS